MEFSFNVNQFLRDEITKVNSTLQPCRSGNGRYGFQNLQRMLYEVVDKIGDASAKAQNLPGSITTGKRLETTNHNLYIMKDSSSGTQTSVVGILKVGTKKLFVYDTKKIQLELTPLCVLDFYVHESRQRKGCGRKLFEFMLKSEGIRAEHLAIDRPSTKFLAFLKRHYNLHKIIPQVNNFVIFDGFFNRHNETNQGKNNGANYQKRNNSPSPWNPLRPPSGKRTITPLQHHLQQQHQQYQQQQQQQYQQQHHQQQQQQQHREFRNIDPNSIQQGDSHMHHNSVGDVPYSRHRATPTNSRAATPTSAPLPNGIHPGNSYNGNQSPVQSMNTNHFFNGNRNKSASPQMYLTMGTNPSVLRNHQQQPKNVNGMFPPNNETAGYPRGSTGMTTDNRLRSGHDTSSGYMDTNNRNAAVFNEERLQEPKRDHVMLPAIMNGGLRGSPQSRASVHNQPPSEVVVQRPPSGKINSHGLNKNHLSNPPLLQREGPSQEYRTMVNDNPDHLSKYGSAPPSFESSQMAHQPMMSGNSSNGYTASTKPPYAAATSPFKYPSTSQKNTSWTVFGVLRDQRLNPTINTKYTPGRLW